MQTALPCPLPPASLLLSAQFAAAFTDCYVIEAPSPVTQAQFVEAFYTSPVFKLERLVLQVFTGRLISDQQARDLALGRSDDFAVWKVAQRLGDQLLLADQTGRTCSWLMVDGVHGVGGTGGVETAAASPASPVTRLYFGSAVLPRVDRRTGERRFGLLFAVLLGFHRRYSQALLRAAASRLAKTPGAP